MPPVTAVSVFDAARAYLNDNSGSLWTDAVLLPYLKQAYEYGRNEQALRNLPNAYKTDTQTIAAGAIVFPDVVDMLIPIKVEERASGSNDPYSPMTETVWDGDDTTPVDNLIVWNWRNQVINFRGALTDRQVRVYYMGDMDPTGITVGSTDLLGNVRVFLGAKVAALVQEFVNQNPSLASSSNAIAEEQMKKIIEVQVKARQAVPRRFRPHIAYPRFWGTFR